MNKKMSVLIIALIFCIAMCFVMAGEDDRYGAVETAAGQSGDERYVLLLEEDCIALYTVDGEERSLIKKEKNSPLRNRDKENLKEGITVYNMEEALMLFEDFIS